MINVMLNYSNLTTSKFDEIKNKYISNIEEHNKEILNLNSNDNRNNTFMPFALKQRNTPFKLIIIDPNDGGIVFESSDGSFAWEGIDKRDGKKVNPKKAYIWKVTLLSPEKGEKSEYKGTITLVE